MNVLWHPENCACEDCLATLSEEDRVLVWRLHTLVEAGYAVADAEEIASSHADLHEAVELVTSGCKPETAVKILL